MASDDDTSGSDMREQGPRRTVASGAEPEGKGAQTRRSVLRAAIERFGRDGYRATSVADIARDAGVGGSVPYAYFSGKEGLFLAALDEDAAAVIEAGLSGLLENRDPRQWRESLVFTLVEAVQLHPLARRVLSGLEPEVTDRMLDLPALAEMRKAVAERLSLGQLAGEIRTDIDPVVIANGSVVIIISLMMSVLQFGSEGAVAHGPDVLAVFEAAIERPPH